MLVYHANWSGGALRLWAESLERYLARSNGSPDQPPRDDRQHPFTAPAGQVTQFLRSAGVIDSKPEPEAFEAGAIDLRLPRDATGPWPSDRLARLAGADERAVDPYLGEFAVECVTIPNRRALEFLFDMNDARQRRAIDGDQGLRYWIAVAEFIVDLLSQQRFVPALSQRGGGSPQGEHHLLGGWQPWLHDEETRVRVGALLAAMPASVRAAADRHHSQPWAILSDALRTLTDAAVRHALINERFIEAVEDRDASSDPHVAWLRGLLDADDRVPAPTHMDMALLRDANAWLSRIAETAKDQPLRLCFALVEPASTSSNGELNAAPEWKLTLHLQSTDKAAVLLDAADIWARGASGSGGRLGVPQVEHPQELLLAELAKAARVYSKIETALAEQAPTEISLTTLEAYEFLREVRPLLEESGFGVIVPAWWDQPAGHLGARLHIESPEAQAEAAASKSPAGSAPIASTLGLNSLVKFRWQVAIGEESLSREEFEMLVRQASPLAQIRGRWIEINPRQLESARELFAQPTEGQMTLLEAIHVANGLDGRGVSLPVVGFDASGWVADVLGASSGGDHRMPVLDQPERFIGTLRPYQKTGLSWLAFMDRFGLGVCLADDMGLGKTIQFIAMLLNEREGLGVRGQGFGLAPTLLVVPTSVVANWVREVARFAPTLTAYVHHGPARAMGEAFETSAMSHDVVITTYPLVGRDHDTLKRIKWHRVALDEAQYIKNPPTKQATAIRSLHAPRRVALTGTPVENRLSELWSIMEFCNPGYLGPQGEFRRTFAVPVERRHDFRQAERLKQMVRPFILRRVKTDPTVIDDLPECLETKEFATLTSEQAALYQQLVNRMLAEVDQAEGIQRRGLVLATLVRLKQICNHPAQYLEAKGVAAEVEQDAISAKPQAAVDATGSSRSGKARRLMELLEEVLAAGDKALIFTQFRQMGHMLTAMIQSDLDAEALFLHGGTPANKRQHLVDRFQDPGGGAPVFVLSLKAGGLGLNLTAANHVFHFDRWWNPAVENQATDRAFRIGQTRNVQVHKFVCVGTLEERIDQMIEQKTELAQNIIGSGEQWLTELSTGQLKDLLTLRQTAVEESA